MNAKHQMEVVNTVVLTPLGVSPAAVTQGISWMEMDWTAVVRNYSKWIIFIIWYILSVKLLNHCLIVFIDINECNTTNGGCEHSCTNTIGSFICNCELGYQLDENGLNCNGKKLLKMNNLHYLASILYIFQPYISVKLIYYCLLVPLNATLQMEALSHK